MRPRRIGSSASFKFFQVSRLMIAKLAIIIIAAALAIFSLPAAWVERFYSNGIYPQLQSLVTPISNLIPFAVSDALIVAAIAGIPVWWTIRIKKAGRGKRRQAFARLALRSLVLVAVSFLSFQVLWGLNYLREPLTLKLAYDEQRITPQALGQLARLTVERLNAESAEAHNGQWPQDEELRRLLKPSFDATVTEIGNRYSIAAAIPKASLFNSYLSAAGIEGFIDPFALEVVLDTELLAVEKPFTLAHEWAHLAGFADESEANFVALLTCARSEAAALRYAGWLALYQYLPRLAPDRSNGSPHAEPPLHLAPEVVADLRAINERANRRLNARLSRAQSEMYDRFLKANRVQAGIASYGMLVRLMLGTQFDSGWTPSLRPGS